MADIGDIAQIQRRQSRLSRFGVALTRAVILLHIKTDIGVGTAQMDGCRPAKRHRGIPVPEACFRQRIGAPPVPCSADRGAHPPQSASRRSACARAYVTP